MTAPTSQPMTAAQRGTLAAAVLGSAIVFLDATVVYLALPRLGTQLESTLLGRFEAQTYVTSGYLATLAAFLVLGGALGDYFGRRRIFLIGLALFGLTSMLCGFAPNLELLVLGRVLQGVAGALLVPGSLAIITNTFEGPSRARAFGLWAAVTSALSTLGPPLGGILLELSGWRALFIINAPLVAAGLFLAWRFMRESRDESATGHFDWLGALVAAVAVGGLAFGLTRGQEGQWRDPVAFAAIGVGVLALVAFPILMARGRHPLVPLSLFRRREFATINLSTFLIYGALYASAAFQALFLQSTLGYTPLGAAIVGLPTGILLTLLSARVGGLAGRIGARPFMVVGPLVMAAGLLWWQTVPATAEPWAAQLGSAASLVPPLDALIGPLVATTIFGTGIALLVAPLTTALMSSVPSRNSGIASAINNALSRVGQPLVAAAVFIVVSGSFYASLAAAVPGTDPDDPALRAAYQPLNPPPADADPALAAAAKEASTDSFHLAYLVGAGLLVAGAGVNYVGLRPLGRATTAPTPNRTGTHGSSGPPES
jgi:EmrB/QacA subfamily drug resistance transporter